MRKLKISITDARRKCELDVIMKLGMVCDVRWVWYRSTWIPRTLNNYVNCSASPGQVQINHVAIYSSIRNSTIHTPVTSLLPGFKFIIIKITSPILSQDTNHSFHSRCFPTTRGTGAKLHQRRKQQTRGRREPSDWRHQRLP